MNSPMAPVIQQEYRITILSGPDQGTTYKLMSPRVTIGRGSDNDIVLGYDKQCSRNHVVIEFDAQKKSFKVKDITEKNTIFVDGVETKSAILTSDSDIQIGKTKLKFQVKMDNALAAQAASPQGMTHQQHPRMPTSPPPQAPPIGAPGGRRSKKKRRSQAGNKKLRFYLISGSVIVLFVALLQGQDGGKKKDSPGIRTEEQIEADIKVAKELKEEAEKRNQLLKTNRAAKEAQSAYVRGFRDFEKGQYERAIQAFQACISLNPQHGLCQRYYKLSQLRFRELIHHHMTLGTRYRDQNQFRSCAASFRNAMQMIKDRSSPIYKEAKANYEACQSFLEGRF